MQEQEECVGGSEGTKLARHPTCRATQLSRILQPHLTQPLACKAKRVPPFRAPQRRAAAITAVQAANSKAESSGRKGTGDAIYSPAEQARPGSGNVSALTCQPGSLAAPPAPGLEARPQPRPEASGNATWTFPDVPLPAPAPHTSAPRGRGAAAAVTGARGPTAHDTPPALRPPEAASSTGTRSREAGSEGPEVALP